MTTSISDIFLVYNQLDKQTTITTTPTFSNGHFDWAGVAGVGGLVPLRSNIGLAPLHCDHSHTVIENEIVLCTICGEEVKKSILHNAEWNSQMDKQNKSCVRVIARKIDDKNLDHDTDKMGFSAVVKSKAHDYYKIVSNGQIFRGSTRKAIVFACIYYAFQSLKIHMALEELLILFEISKKNAMKGLKLVYCNVKIESVPNVRDTDDDLILDVLKLFETTKEQKIEICDLYQLVKNKSSNLNKARIHSVIVSVIYYWVSNKKIDLSMIEFASITKISHLTISKNLKEIHNVLK